MREVIQITDRLCVFAPEKNINRIADDGTWFSNWSARWELVTQRLECCGKDLSKIRITKKD